MPTIIGMLCLMWAASVYTAYGISAHPRQEWLVESLAGILFLIPVVNLLRGPGSLTVAARLIGGALIAHSVWDALHWPGSPIIQTPIDPWIPQVCPWIDLPVGALLLIRGK